MSNILDITQEQMDDAIILNLDMPTIPEYFKDEFGADNAGGYLTSRPDAILNDVFVIHTTKDATYNVLSSSFFDPFILRVSDNSGDNIVSDNGGIYSPYSIDHVQFKAAYTGDHYISASWDQGRAVAHKKVSVSVFEDLDTVKDYDRVFNWAETEYSDLFPGDATTEQVQGYNARLYEGHALGEKDGEIFYYDGTEITLVGTTAGFLDQAITDGF